MNAVDLQQVSPCPGDDMNLISQYAIPDLKYVRLSDTRIDLSHFPDFMIIGPQRTGTTWLYENLNQHPHIFLSNPKEIFYFNILDKPDNPRYKSNDLAWYLNFFYDTPEQYSHKNMSALTKFGERYNPKIRGEATASYAAMGKHLIKEIATLNPNIKIILMIRNPVARAWSHAKYFFINQSTKTFADYSGKEFKNFFNIDYQIACGRFTEIIKNWSSLLKEDNLFVGSFYDIGKFPDQLLLRVFNFLGVRSDSKYIGPLARERIHSTEKIEMPGKYRKMLEEMFRDELDKIKQTFNLPWETES